MKEFECDVEPGMLLEVRVSPTKKRVVVGLSKLGSEIGDVRLLPEQVRELRRALRKALRAIEGHKP